MSFFRGCVCSISIMLLATTVKAAPYQYELAVGYSDVETLWDASVSGFLEETADSDRTKVQFIYYPMAVAEKNGPLAQRAFLSKASSIAGSISEDGYEGGVDYDTQNIEGRYVAPSGYIFGVSYKKEQADDNSEKDRDIGFELGAYLSDTSEVSLSVNSIKRKYIDFSFVDFSSTESFRTYTLAYEQLFNSAASNRYFAHGLNFTYVNSDSGIWKQVDLNSSYYLSDSISLSAGVTYTENEGYVVSTVTFGTEYFVSEQFFTNLSFSRRLNANATRRDMISVNLGTRF